MPGQRRRSSPQFKTEAVHMVIETGKLIAAARDRSIVGTHPQMTTLARFDGSWRHGSWFVIVVLFSPGCAVVKLYLVMGHAQIVNPVSREAASGDPLAASGGGASWTSRGCGNPSRGSPLTG
jgi:hypothetical protein